MEAGFIFIKNIFYFIKINFSMLLQHVPRLSVAESELDSSTVEELEMTDSVDESKEFKSLSRSGDE